jgi:hypothetical protein
MPLSQISIVKAAPSELLASTEILPPCGPYRHLSIHQRAYPHLQQFPMFQEHVEGTQVIIHDEKGALMFHAGLTFLFCPGSVALQ